MEKEDFEEEKIRRNSIHEIFNCPCGAVFIGRNIDFDKHFQFDCPVYREAHEKLTTNPPLRGR